MRKSTSEMTEGEARVLADIGEYGLHIVHVLEDDGGGARKDVRFSYTVGLWHTFDQPEVIVVGLPEDTAHELLNAVADNASEGERYAAGSRCEDLLQGYPVRFLPLDDQVVTDRMGVARWAYDGDRFEVVQLVYPDRRGRWPWDESTRDGFRRCQPVIGRREPRR